MNTIREDIYYAFIKLRKTIESRMNFPDLDDDTKKYLERIKSYIDDKTIFDSKLNRRCEVMTMKQLGKSLRDLADVYDMLDDVLQPTKLFKNEWHYRIEINMLLERSYSIIKNVFNELTRNGMEKEIKYKYILMIEAFTSEFKIYDKQGNTEYTFTQLTELLNMGREILHNLKYFLKLLPTEYSDFIPCLFIDINAHIIEISKFLAREEIVQISTKTYDDFRDIYADYKEG